MLYYVIFALAAVSTCSGGNPAVPVLKNELSLLSQLMDSIEQRIQAVAKTEASAITSASMTCWAIHLAGFKSDIENAYTQTLSAIRGELQTKLDSSDKMNQSELDALEEQLSDSSDQGITNRLTSSVELFIHSATAILNQLNSAQAFTCSS